MAKRKARWGKWERRAFAPPTAETVSGIARVYGATEAEIIAEFEQGARESTLWENGIYLVIVTGHKPTTPYMPLMVWLSIRRSDRKPVGVEHFRDFQRIKNELVGPEFEAVELYPAESRLVDTSNQYHLWVVKREGWRFPFGYPDRDVVRENVANTVQRPFE